MEIKNQCKTRARHWIGRSIPIKPETFRSTENRRSNVNSWRYTTSNIFTRIYDTAVAAPVTKRTELHKPIGETENEIFDFFRKKKSRQKDIEDLKVT